LEQSGEEGPVYQYILSTVENVNGKFCQTGSAPNFQGGIITLCTCKHWMRTFRSPERWKNCWIAGHTNVKAGDGQQHLFYLMKIQDAYENFLDLWNAEFWKESHYDRKAKNTANNPFGDVYEPKKGVNRNKREAHNPNSYKISCKEHVHYESGKSTLWKEDIKIKYKRESALLIGDSGKSYLWNIPKICVPQYGRGCKKWKNIDAYLEHLERSGE